MFLIGLALYVSITRERDRVGKYALLALIATLGAIYFAALYGPPPPNSQAVAMAGHLSWLFVAWAYWIDRHRAMGKEPVISGGVWVWSHFWAALPFSMATTAVRARNGT